MVNTFATKNNKEFLNKTVSYSYVIIVAKTVPLNYLKNGHSITYMLKGYQTNCYDEFIF